MLSKRSFILLLIWGLVSTTNLFAQLNKQYFYNQARNHIYQEQYSDAIRSLNTLIRTDSTFADAWFLRGFSKYNLNDLHGALADFSKAIKFNPVFSQAYLYRGVVYNRFARYSLALVDFETAIDLRPNSADGYYSRGINYLLTQKPLEAISDFLNVIRFEPKNVDAWINLGTSRLYAGDSLAALNDYSRAINLNPFYSESYSKRGRLYYELKKFELAKNDFNSAINYDKNTSLNFFFRALTYNSLEQKDSALFDLNRAIDLTPNNALSIYNRALILWEVGDIRNAFRDFESVIELNPENVLVYYNRAVLNYETDRFSDAITDFSTAIELFPDFANAYLGRSSAHQRLGNYFESQKDKTYAQSIAERYATTGGNAFTDTSKRFNELIAFDSDFSTKTAIPSLGDYNSKPVDILPFIRIIVVPANELKTTTQLYSPIDSLNSQLVEYGIALTFGIDKRPFNLELDNIDNEFLMNFIQGLKWSSEKKFNQAINAFEAALKISPNNVPALLCLATEKADMVSFIASFENELNTISLNDRSTREGQPTSSLQPESFSESLEIFSEIAQKLPTKSIMLYNLGNIYALSGDIDKAQLKYSEAIEINSNSAEAWFNRGLLHFMQNDKPNGCIDMGKAGELGLKQAYLLIHRFCR